jgi:hypothetical protein
MVNGETTTVGVLIKPRLETRPEFLIDGPRNYGG